MSDGILKDFLASGKKLLDDTKSPRRPLPKKEKVSKGEITGTPAPDGDPHKTFVRRSVQEKPKKSEIVEQFKKFIEVAESQL